MVCHQRLRLRWRLSITKRPCTTAQCGAMLNRWMWMRRLLLACCTLFWMGVNAQALTAVAAGDTITAVRLRPDEKLLLDGTLSHPAWLRAPVHTSFVEKDPVFGAVPKQATRVQVLFDEAAIYVGVTALDSSPQLIRDVLVRPDGVIRTQDFVMVYLDAIGQRNSAQFFRVNAAGSMGDGMHTAADDNEDFAPDFDWDAATARTPEGWTAVLRLPFASLRFASGPQDWRILVGRRLPRDQFYLFTSSPIPRDAPSFIATLQPLAGLELPQQHSFLTLRPSVTLRSSRVGGGRGGITDGVSKTVLETTLDLKWRPLAEAVIDATVNPDFSQVALDVPQLAGNTQFAIYLPEKRPFFFESADLLRSPTDALYTRSFTQPRWGLRSTWRGQDWAGSAFAIQDKGGGQVLLPGPYGTGAADQPASKTLAARASANLGGDGKFSVGGLLAARRYDQGRGDNQVLGPDFNWAVTDQWKLRGQWLHSQTTAQAEDTTDGRTVLRRGASQSGDRVWLRLSRQTGEGETGLVLDDIGPGFRHDSGFVSQSGVRVLDAFQSVGWQGLGPFNEFYLNFKALQVRDRVSGRVVQELVRPGLWSSSVSNVEWWANLSVYSALRIAADKPLLHERYVSTGLTLAPAPWLPLLEISGDAGRLADTTANTVRRGGRLNLSAKGRPLSRLEVEPSLNQAWLDGAGQRVYREQALQLLAVWHFDASHNLRAIVQRSALDRRAEAGVGASESASRTVSLTYSWRRSAGTRLFVGATRSSAGVNSIVNNTEAFVKLQVDMDDLRSDLRTLWR
jgi:Domain of unknown function (DUF5916)